MASLMEVWGNGALLPSAVAPAPTLPPMSTLPPAPTVEQRGVDPSWTRPGVWWAGAPVGPVSPTEPARAPDGWSTMDARFVVGAAATLLSFNVLLIVLVIALLVQVATVTRLSG